MKSSRQAQLRLHVSNDLHDIADTCDEQFGLYIMFPIGWMYYFGTNLEERFSVPDFWPSPESTHKIPFEREEIKAEVERMKARRLAKRARRLQMEGKECGQVTQDKATDATSERSKGQLMRWSLDRGDWVPLDTPQQGTGMVE